MRRMRVNQCFLRNVSALDKKNLAVWRCSTNAKCQPDECRTTRKLEAREADAHTGLVRVCEEGTAIGLELKRVARLYLESRNRLGGMLVVLANN